MSKSSGTERSFSKATSSSWQAIYRHSTTTSCPASQFRVYQRRRKKILISSKPKATTEHETRPLGASYASSIMATTPSHIATKHCRRRGRRTLSPLPLAASLRRQLPNLLGKAEKRSLSIIFPLDAQTPTFIRARPLPWCAL